MNWEERSQDEWRCVDAHGRIIARIERYRGEYSAWYESNLVGVFVSLETAQKAVDNKARPEFPGKPINIDKLTKGCSW